MSGGDVLSANAVFAFLVDDSRELEGEAHEFAAELLLPVSST